MNTTIYMIRHAESPYDDGTERTRGLTTKGIRDVEKVTDILLEEGINVIISSPYQRAILSVKELAQALNLDIEIKEDLRERFFSLEIVENLSSVISDKFYDFDYSLLGGESNSVCQKRAISVIKNILKEHNGKKIAIGTHGLVMTLMLNYFDSRYGLEFFTQLDKPDIYRLKFEHLDLIEVTRLWER